MEKINGQNIYLLGTLGTWYDNGFIWGQAEINGKRQSFRIHVTEIVKMVGDFNFNVNLPDGDKRRTHIYLEVDESVYDDSCEVTEETKSLVA